MPPRGWRTCKTESPVSQRAMRSARPAYKLTRGGRSDNSRYLLRQIPLQLFCQLLAELVGQHRRVEPVERKVPPVHGFHQRLEHLRLLPLLVPEAKVLATLHQAQRLDLS